MRSLYRSVDLPTAKHLYCVAVKNLWTDLLAIHLIDYTGITRKTVIEMLQHANKSAERGNTESALLPPIIERRVSLAEFHSADEVFTSGTMGELSPVVDIDGRVIGSGKPGPVTSLIQAEFRKLTETEGVPIPFKN